MSSLIIETTGSKKKKMFKEPGIDSAGLLTSLILNSVPSLMNFFQGKLFYI
jgi:hypothetical protein